LTEDLNDIEWRRVWLSCFACSVGLQADRENAEQLLTEMAARRSRAVFILDGLEDLFQKFSSDPNQQNALRVLLTDCPYWLRSLRGCSLGLIIFVRYDLVQAAIQQNLHQFLIRSRRLRWEREEALRLVAWVCGRADALEEKDVVRTARVEELSRILQKVWGLKMGSDRSREARSESWFLAALSVFNLQIQARDIVNFLAVTARHSAQDFGKWNDRLLTPAAMSKALPECSKKKIKEVEEENHVVRDILQKLRKADAEQKRVPFELDAVGLDRSEARILEANGILFQQEDQYWIPELFRHELGFKAERRPRILAVARLVQSRNDPA